MRIEFESGGATYVADSLDAFQQLHVVRKLGPILPKLVPVFVKLQAAGANALRDDLAGIAEAAGPFADALADMSDEHVDYVVKTCLSVVRRSANGTMSPVMVNGAIMYADMGLGEIMPIVVRILRENLGNFFQGLLANQAQAAATIPAPIG